ncbi:L-idonate 5-dehydrogenase [Rosenbergiella collisarenosi]|uniref:L-idonate 5-dehydrogenase n=1 Tax=Rosenbergiella collisarenosi TaxID=1544695 RepID=UPI001F4D3680|nr:L-idonate 5-dehydrogenase [Rosenbergiella collisarenosi]
MTITTHSCVVKGKQAVDVVTQTVDYSGKGTLIKVLRGGICGSDLHYYQHGRVGNYAIKMPMVLGHEVIGTVEQSDSPKLQPGQKVAINPAKACGECQYCLADESNQCLAMQFFGSAMRQPHVDGGFTQYKVVETSQCIPFAASLDERVMVFAEPLAVCLHALNQAGGVTNKRVFVSGVGPIGCLIVAAAKASGASEIVCSDISARALALADTLGASATLLADDEMVSYRTDKGVFDVSFEASGHPSASTRCIDVTRAKGCIVQVGMGGDIPQFPMMTVIAKELRIVGTFRFTHEFTTAVEWLASGKINPLPLFSGEYSYREVDEALQFAGDKHHASKVQLVF